MAVPSKLTSGHHWLAFKPSVSSSSSSSASAVLAAVAWKKRTSCLVTMNCTPLQQNLDEQRQEHQLQSQLEDEETQAQDVGIMCEPCNGKGWLLCDFCKGQKTNVKTDNNRIYRRCPNCKAIGYVLCSNCKVFKCVTFPDYSDGEI